MQQPPNLKGKRKRHKGAGLNKRLKRATRGDKINFGDFGLVALENGQLTARQIESARRAISRAIKRGGKVYIRPFADKPITQKPLEVRQGKGKGNIEYWVAMVQPGRVIFELEGVDEALARKAFSLAASKLPFKSKFRERDVI